MKITCSCGSNIFNTPTSIARHSITKKHLNSKSLQIQTTHDNKNPWVKLIDFSTGQKLQDYKHQDNFQHVANVIIDNSISRKTQIQFIQQIDILQYKKQCEWIYLFTINDVIVKIGGTRTGIQKRCMSYLCGHHTKSRGKSGDCSKTNAFIYNTFEYYLLQNMEIKMYAFKLPYIEANVEILNIKTLAPAILYHVYESRYLSDFSKTYNSYPALNNNCDPNY